METSENRSDISRQMDSDDDQIEQVHSSTSGSHPSHPKSEIQSYNAPAYTNIWQAGLDKNVSTVLMSGSDKRSAQC
jgi:hypothetical protein